MDTYKPCLDPIRKALSSPSDKELQHAAFSALLPNVKKTEEFYVAANKVAEGVPELLGKLGSGVGGNGLAGKGRFIGSFFWY